MSDCLRVLLGTGRQEVVPGGVEGLPRFLKAVGRAAAPVAQCIGGENPNFHSHWHVKLL